MRRIASSWQTLRGRVAAFGALTPPQRRIVLLALAAFPVVAASLRIWGLGRVQETLLRRPLRRLLAPAADMERDSVVMLVETAARTGARSANCLERSLLLMWVLGSLGTATELRIGVRREAEDLLFHAWLEDAGRVLNDEPDVASRYAAFEGAILPQGMRLV